MPNDPAPTVSGWGRIALPGREDFSEDLVKLSEDAVLSRGLGRAYGDSACPPASDPRVATTTLADRILSFDEETGILRAEAGLSLFELKRFFLPRHWFTPVTPGTQFVTLGGAVAADVHGKNHHVEGCFGEHVTKLLMRVADGRILECGPDEEPELFWATVGGMGLTGHILEVEFRMQRVASAWIEGESFRVPNIDSFIDHLKEAAAEWPMTMGWIDCLSKGSKLGRGILYRGRWAKPSDAPNKPPAPKKRVSIPFEFPSWLLNKLTVAAFNELLYRSHIPERKASIQHPDQFFYPLDKILHWNKMYGKRGFTQYQCVLPDSAGRGAARRFLEYLTELGGASSFLCVIKDCGPENKGMLSFPMRGISIALDLSVDDGTKQLVDDLNRLVIEMGGRIYLAKDNFTSAADYRAMEPRLDKWLAVRDKWDPERRIRSAQSVRILGDPE